MGGMTKQMRADAPARTVALFVSAMIIAAALIVARQAAAAEAGTPGWTAGEVRGEARIRAAGAPWKSLRPGDAIPANAEIETGPAGRASLTGPVGSVTVLPNSGLSLPRAAGDDPRIVQRRGNLQFAIAAADGRTLRIDTPFLTAAIGRATVTLAVNARNAALYVSGGTARVTSVLTGEAALVGREYVAWVNAPSGGRLKTVAIHPHAAPRAAEPRKSPARAPRGNYGRALAGLADGRARG